MAFLVPLLLVLAALQDPSARPPRLVLEGLDGSRREVDPATLVLTDPREQEAWVVRPESFPRPSTPPSPMPRGRIELADGDELLGALAGGAGETLDLELIGGVQLPIDVSWIRSIVLPDNLPPGELDPLEAPDEGDRIYRKTGGGLDRIDGTIESFLAAGVRFESVLGAKVFPWTEIAALFIEVLDDTASGDEDVPVVCDLVDGSRVRGGLIRVEGDACHLRVAGSELTLTLGSVAEILVDDGRLTFLSDLAVASEEGKGAPFGDELGMVWPHRVDRSVAGAELVVAGVAWRRGIGTHAPTKLTYVLDDDYAVLRGRVGIDDSALWNPEDARGSVIFRIWVDGKAAWESAVVRGGDVATAIPDIPLEGARELVLESDMVRDFRGDRANWLRLVLVR